ncbi:MAG: phosphotransacetylase family protein [Oscillatoria sp. PMC 1051.18]|nr:phosphotransacetylase family protein [Oscillatoria sp. PMC 1050.18]MEC5031625.1 phosphotransacetylase family protein [Oscillatoria sp. PMC 1051.18]
MAKSAKNLLIGSTEAYSGKSTTILGVIHQLHAKGIVVAYGKPLGTLPASQTNKTGEEDVKFVREILELPKDRVLEPLLSLDEKAIALRLSGEDTTNYNVQLESYLNEVSGDLLLLEGSGTLFEGTLFGLSALEVAERVDASVLVVTRYHSFLAVDSLLAAKQLLGSRLIGVLINGIPEELLETVNQEMRPFLETQGIPVLGMLPKNNLLRSVSVRELVQQLKAKVLCRRDRLDLMVETLTIGAMNVNSAIEYFRKGRNMAVVTGGDRTDLQLAALETSTQCLILTGHVSPQPLVLQRAEDLEIPILSVDLDTLTTVEIADRAFGQVRLAEPIKVKCIQQLMSQYFDLDRLVNSLKL